MALSQLLHVAAACIITIEVFLRLAWSKFRLYIAHGGNFRNQNGVVMKAVPKESRFLRFTHGREISNEGKMMAGEDPYILWNSGNAEIVLHTPEHMKGLYCREAGEHGKAQNMNMGHYFGRIMGKAVGVLNGQAWKTTRRVFDPHLSWAKAIASQKDLSQIVKDWVRDLEASSDSSEQHPQTNFSIQVDAATAVRTLPFKLIALALYGESLTNEAWVELLRLNSMHEKVVSTTFFGSLERSKWYCSLPTNSKTEMDSFEVQWRDWNSKIIEAANIEGKNCPVATMYRSVDDGTVPLLEFLHTIDEILFANIDVTAGVLAFLMINLAINSETQTELREEILSRALDGKESIDRYFKQSDTLLDYTCTESVRLAPAAWFSLPEYATNELTISGYKIPAGVPFIVDWARLNTQSPVWNPPDSKITGAQFYPRRFANLASKDHRWSFLRFGIGSRKCIGKNFSPVMMKVFLIELLQQFELSVNDGEQVETRRDRFTVTPKKTVKLSKISQKLYLV
ncbi:cytochrome P450 [Microthyrium microscopicum]|uniref:Cytochrome P450 n=1 Tax=Microthyrium microscopicum TaxID=703497 RepID=A0A6A6UAM1_9PEZI|nr:cytochrome P450 [Microthyrium microscopicum]